MRPVLLAGTLGLQADLVFTITTASPSTAKLKAGFPMIRPNASAPITGM